MIREFLHLGHVKRRLIAGTLSNACAFAYFFIITAVGNLQLALLQDSPAQPTPYTPWSVSGSIALGAVFLFATYFLNGGAHGRDYLIRYFSLSAVVAIWIAVPFQAMLWLSQESESLAALEWFDPVFILLANIAYFSFVAYQVRDVAKRAEAVGK